MAAGKAVLWAVAVRVAVVWAVAVRVAVAWAVAVWAAARGTARGAVAAGAWVETVELQLVAVAVRAVGSATRHTYPARRCSLLVGL